MTKMFKELQEKTLTQKIEALDNNILDNYNQVMEDIQDKANNGNNTVYIHYPIYPAVLDILDYIGFTVRPIQSYNFISW